MKTIQVRIEKLIRCILILFCIFVILVSLVEPFLVSDTKPVFCLAAAVVYSFMLFGFYSFCKSRPENFLNKAVYAAIFFAFALQLIIVFQMQVVPRVDLSHIYDQCMEMLENDTVYLTDQDYFGFYTNNIPLCIVIYWVFRAACALGFQNYRIAGGIFNVILMLEVYLLSWRMLKRLANMRTASFVMFFILTNPVYYAFSS